MHLTLIDILSKDPLKNLELEEYIYRSKFSPGPEENDLLIRFWVNDPCLIMGKFQKRELEVNEDYISKNPIPVLRRFTGGGTVYHDHGTLNFTLLKKRNNIFYSSQILEEAAWISGLLKEAICNLPKIYTAGIHVDSRSNIFHEKRKLTGTALAVAKSKYLYHASILIDTNLDSLNKSINQNPIYPESGKGFVKSIRSPVMNLKELFPEEADSSKGRDDLIERLKSSIISTFRKRLNIITTVATISELRDIENTF